MVINSHPLYQLSYRGRCCGATSKRTGPRVSTAEWRGPQRLLDVPWEALDGIRAPVLTAVAQVLDGAAGRAGPGQPASRASLLVLGATPGGRGDASSALGLWRRRLRSWCRRRRGARGPARQLPVGPGGPPTRARPGARGRRPPTAAWARGRQRWEDAWSVPDWLARHTVAELGEEQAERFWASLVTPGPTFLRANLLKTSVEALQVSTWLPRDLVTVARSGRARRPCGSPGARPNILGLARPPAGPLRGPGPGKPAARACWWNPSRESASWTSARAPGARRCCWPRKRGRAHSIDAWDVDASRLAAAADAGPARGSAWACGSWERARRPSYDRVLVDAPCSELGTLRRGPDLRWRLRARGPRASTWRSRPRSSRPALAACGREGASSTPPAP